MNPTHIRIVQRACNIRHFVYRAHVSKRTGKLLKIVAGCRTWSTFEEARQHYRGLSRYRIARWADSYSRSILESAYRIEAQGLLRNLERDVGRVSMRIRRAKRRGR